MSDSSKVCAICRARKPKRRCPGIAGDICPACCGKEREITVDCPVHCEYLWEAHEHAKVPGTDVEYMPESGLDLGDNFAQEKELHLIQVLGRIAKLVNAEGQWLDSDVREGLSAIAETYRVAESGLFYRPLVPNPRASKVAEVLLEEVENSKWPKPLVRQLIEFVRRVAAIHNNGRPKCRAFLVVLYRGFPQTETNEAEKSVILA